MTTCLGRILRIVLVTALCAATIATSASPIHSQFTIIASVTNLNDDGDGSLRKAILDTNGSLGADEIRIEVSGQLNLLSALPAITEAVTINAPGAAFIIDGQDIFQGLIIRNVPVSISGVTVQNAQSFGNVPGGGIVSDGNLTLNNVNVLDSTSGGLGGGVSTPGSIVATGGIFRGDYSSINGGAIYAGGNLSLTNVEVTNNNAEAHGGGVYAVGNVEISGGAFLSNTAAFYGGGLAINEAAVLTNVLFQNNCSVTRAGGGIILLDYVPVTFTNVNFIANTADEDGGGGIAAVGPGGPAAAPELLFNGGRFERNRAILSTGGGIKANNVVLTNTLFISNMASSGAGAHLLRVVATGGSFEQNQGGGLAATSMNLNGTQFTGNTGGSGAAVVTGGGKATNVLFANNRSGSGGMSGSAGGLNVGGPTTISGSQFINNTGTGGGGLHATTTVTVSVTLFLGNHAPRGGGVLHLSGDGTFVNMLFAGNTASASGAAMQVQGSGVATIQHVTMASSAFITTSALATTKDVVVFQNNILANHAVGLEVTSGSVTLSNNLFHNNGIDIAGSVVLDVDHRTGDPLFVSPDTNNFHLQVGSPAADTGRDVGITTDFDGDLRPFSTGFDIGYDEVTELPASTSTPTSTLTPTPTLTPPASGTADSTPTSTATPTATNTPDGVLIPTGTETPTPTATTVTGTGLTHPLHLPTLHR